MGMNDIIDRGKKYVMTPIGDVSESWDRIVAGKDIIKELIEELEKCSKQPDYNFSPGKVFIQPQPWKVEDEYTELLMAVETKHPGESRHDTALRYIREAERGRVTVAEHMGIMAAKIKDQFIAMEKPTPNQIKAVQRTLTMWRWLADDPSREKIDYFEYWPKDARPKDICYLCEEWRSCNDIISCPLAKPGFYCSDLMSPFAAWLETRGTARLRQHHAQNIVRTCEAWLEQYNIPYFKRYEPWQP